MAHKWARLHNPCRLGAPHRCTTREELEVAHKWAWWLHNPCRLAGSHRFRASAQSEVSTSGPGGYITPAACGVPNASERGAESKVAHKWAGLLHNPCDLHHKWGRWLHNPCRLGGPGRLKGGGDQKWPTSRPDGYITPAAWVVPTALERGAESQVDHKWAGGRLRGLHRLRAGGAELEVAHRWTGLLHNPCHLGCPHRFTAGGAELEVAHKWAGWLHSPFRLGVSHRFTGGAESEVARKWAV